MTLKDKITEDMKSAMRAKETARLGTVRLLRAAMKQKEVDARVKKGGTNFQGLCPFHNEKSPSFTVSPAKQFYHCFGCGAHGNAIGFLMAYGGLGYVDAIKDLASSAGMQVPEAQPRSREEA